MNVGVGIGIGFSASGSVIARHPGPESKYIDTEPDTDPDGLSDSIGIGIELVDAGYEMRDSAWRITPAQC